jgi:ribosomal protein S17E
MLKLQNSLELFKTIDAEKLLEKLVEQLNKDFQLANINKHFIATITAKSLKNKLDTIVLDLISNKYDDYLNLLYRIDIPEKELAHIKGDKLTDAIEKISFLILKREFQKVWLKKNYKKL